MEALLLCLDVASLVAAFMWAIKNYGATGPVIGLFRFRDGLSGPTAPPAPTAPGRRSSR